MKESNFKFMVKEVRYELLELLESMGKNVSSQETKDGNFCSGKNRKL